MKMSLESWESPDLVLLPLHFSFTNDLGTCASAFDSKKEAGKKVSFPLESNEGGRVATDFVQRF